MIAASGVVKSSLEVAGDSPTLTPTKQPVLLCAPAQKPLDSAELDSMLVLDSGLDSAESTSACNALNAIRLVIETTWISFFIVAPV